MFTGELEIVDEITRLLHGASRLINSNSLERMFRNIFLEFETVITFFEGHIFFSLPAISGPLTYIRRTFPLELVELSSVLLS